MHVAGADDVHRHTRGHERDGRTCLLGQSTFGDSGGRGDHDEDERQAEEDERSSERGLLESSGGVFGRGGHGGEVL